MELTYKKNKMKAGPVTWTSGFGLGTDVGVKFWPPKASAHFLGTGVKAGWSGLEVTAFGNGVNVKNPIAQWFSTDKETQKKRGERKQYHYSVDCELVE